MNFDLAYLLLAAFTGAGTSYGITKIRLSGIEKRLDEATRTLDQFRIESTDRLARIETLLKHQRRD
jgi:hypothetical protein